MQLSFKPSATTTPEKRNMQCRLNEIFNIDSFIKRKPMCDALRQLERTRTYKVSFTFDFKDQVIYFSPGENTHRLGLQEPATLLVSSALKSYRGIALFSVPGFILLITFWPFMIKSTNEVI